MAQQVTTLRATPFFKAFSANQTTTTAQTDDIVESLPTDGRIIPTQAGGVRFRGIELLGFGGDDDNDEFSVYLETIHEVAGYDFGRGSTDAAGNISIPALYDFDYSLDLQYLKRQVTRIDFTINTNAGLAGTTGGVVGSGDSFADVVSQTRTTYGTSLESAMGETSVIGSGASNTNFASYFLPDFGNADMLRLYVDIDGGSGTAADEGNCLVRLYV